MQCFTWSGFILKIYNERKEQNWLTNKEYNEVMFKLANNSVFLIIEQNMAHLIYLIISSDVLKYNYVH